MKNWWKGLRPEVRDSIFGLGFLIFAAVIMLIFAGIAEADPPTPASPIPAQILAMHGWELVGQQFDATNGELLGAPILAACSGDRDYLKGVIEKREDCLAHGLYRTIAECSKAQQGRLTRVRNEGLHWVATVYYCRHKEPGGVI